MLKSFKGFRDFRKNIELEHFKRTNSSSLKSNSRFWIVWSDKKYGTTSIQASKVDKDSIMYSIIIDNETWRALLGKHWATFKVIGF